jgi:hypothetical protein
MSNKLKLNLRGDQYSEMIAKFKNREEQTSLEEALVYLKLRDLDCDNSRALIFAKKYATPHAGRNDASTAPSNATARPASANWTCSNRRAS